jgi:DNA-binding CsgD family transcriptional regulator
VVEVTTELLPVERVVGTADEVRGAMLACDFPLIVWQLPAGVIRLINDDAAALFGLPIVRLLGTPAWELIGPRDAVSRTIALFSSGDIDDLHAERWVQSGSGERVPVQVWTRAVELDGLRGAISLAIPDREVGRLGRDPLVPWRDLMSVGVADRDLKVLRVSNDIRRVLGVDPDEIVGKTVPELFGIDAAQIASDPGGDSLVVHVRTPYRRDDGATVVVCVLLAPVSTSHSATMTFAIAASAATLTGRLTDRVAELETRLRVIGAEVRAARILDQLTTIPSVQNHPQLRDLSTRQWEILSRLLRAERVNTIAAELYISPSTVRNHLAAIFQKFGVHSQAELIDVLRRPDHAPERL